MFEHEYFDVYEYDDIPLDRDCYLMDKKYMREFEEALLASFRGGDSDPVGYVSPVAVRKIHPHSLEMSWYPNVMDRFHEVSITLPRKNLIMVVGSWRYDEKPVLFVDWEWLEELHLRHYSIFGLVDAIGVKAKIRGGELHRSSLTALRSKIDELGDGYEDISFVSFADSLLIKTNWTVGHFQSSVSYTYKPERVLDVIGSLRSIYQETLGLEVYAVLTQGSNEYYDDPLLHTSRSGNHICLNSLGIPFADLMAIDQAVNEAIHNQIHTPADLYLDSKVLNSLQFRFPFDKKGFPSNPYQSRMTGAGIYYCADYRSVSENLDRART